MLILAKQGRKKRVNAERYPGGRIKQAHQRNTAKDVVTAQRLLEAARKRMENPMWATPLGRLFLEDKITSSCVTAGEKYANLVERYRVLIGSPRPTPAILERSPGRALEVDPFNEAELNRAKAVERAYAKASSVLLSMADGIRIAKAIHDLCVLQEHLEHERLIYARQGLAKLAEHFGLVRS